MDGDERRVTITDVDIPFWRLVAIFIKFTLAAIPAYFVVLLIIMLIAAMFSTLFGGMGWMMRDTWRM
ncbi:hypothetical protein [Propylenella binzhouense]|uniref:Uncharacterized protein n=1 Tax=Propylenella binzhouense TaxID=2555902 RepID=A0A964WS96_9HYPH|nr:hypothetical protein [Propylenella binzhouense]MYZ46743.1 hypothetical protein [Propylenella binzhouense]